MNLKHRKLGTFLSARGRLCAVCAASAMALTAAAPASEAIEYPPTLVKPVSDTLHGVEITDKYRWLERNDWWAVKLWSKRQNHLTRQLLDSFPERQRIVERLEHFYGRSQETYPVRYGNRTFVWRHKGLAEHRILYVYDNGLDGPGRVLLDLNERENADQYVTDVVRVSPDGSHIAHVMRRRRHWSGELQIIDTATGTEVGEPIDNVVSKCFVWENDSKSFYYLRWTPFKHGKDDDTFWCRCVYRHELGADWDDDRLVFGKNASTGDRVFFTGSTDRTHLLLYRINWESGKFNGDAYLMELGKRRPRPKPIVKGATALHHFDITDETLVCRCEHEAPFGRIFCCDLNDVSRERWELIVPQQKGPIRDMKIADGRLVVEVLEELETHLLVYSLAGEFLGEIPLPGIGCVKNAHEAPGQPGYLFWFHSLVHQPTMFRVDLDDLKPVAVRVDDYGLDCPRHVMKKVWYTSKDGTPVPMLIVHKKGLALDGDNPVILYGYGGFNIVVDPSFDPALYVWFDAGGIYAVPHLRGGGEMGRGWHEAGKGFRKQNSFDDFIAAAEYLVEHGYTRPGRLGIMGASNGGLLVGVAATERPDLFRAVLCQMPVLDMLRYHLMSDSPSIPTEYGTADDPNEFEDLRAYSPYHNVRAGVTYPATLIVSGVNDRVCDPAHARKMTALLQSTAKPGRPMLLWMDPEIGHYFADQRLRKTIELEADEFTWFMWQLGMIEEPEE
jgi:prolyl oligopeptidase